MNILFLPHNIASMPAITAARLNIEDGITAIALTYEVHKYQELNSQVFILPLRRGSKMQPVKWAISRLKIATELKITESTLNTHKKHLFEKFNVLSKSGLITKAISNKIIQ